ncbi:MAG TPA: 4'-phosphopantetheinyl transferase superfamily protein [Bacteroidia bacterium]|nr:4'-phosphopantetheinyl transferase superfamily protein [Bacteroidia bacterium]
MDLQLTPEQVFCNELLIQDNDCLVFIFCSDSFIAVESELKKLLSNDETERLLKFKFEKDRQTYCIAHGLKRVLLAALLNTKEQVEISTHSNGKPFINHKKHNMPLHFSLSHSEKMIALAFQKNSPLGVDIEKIQPADKYGNVIQHYFTSDEQKLISRSDNDIFFKIWTQKEAIGKATGQGIANLPEIVIPDDYELSTASLGGYILSTCFFRGNEISFKTIHAQDVLNQINILSLRP